MGVVGRMLPDHTIGSEISKSLEAWESKIPEYYYA